MRYLKRGEEAFVSSNPTKELENFTVAFFIAGFELKKHYMR
jgi:hypothetical protein